MSKIDKTDIRVRITSIVVAILSVGFSVFTWFSSEEKLEVKDQEMQLLSQQLFSNQIKLRLLRDSISTLEYSLGHMEAQKDSLATVSDSLSLVSLSYLNQIHKLYDQIDSLTPSAIDAPDSEHIRIFLRWTKPNGNGRVSLGKHPPG